MFGSIRTDLAMEAAQAYRPKLPQGVDMQEEEAGGLHVTTVRISSEEAGRPIGRKPGTYITIQLPALTGSVEPADDTTHLLAGKLAALLPKTGGVLVVGLGNEQMTPDALGPQTARQVLATRHIPQDLAERTGLGGLRPVAVLAPGVLGQTGMETGEIVHSIVRDLGPSAVIVVDALASRSLSRLGNTIQISDTGISPGSGVLNSRKELSRHTLGVPVISMGIPTVVDGATLAYDLLGEAPSKPAQDSARHMMVTPRDIDAIIQRGAKHLSLAINAALQPSLSLEDISYLVS